MKPPLRIWLAITLCFITSTSEFLAGCKCDRPEKGETTHWGGNLSVVEVLDKPRRKMEGVIEFAGDPLKGAFVEIFDHPEHLLGDVPDERVGGLKQKRLEACKTKADGKFCFRNLPPGKYEIRSSVDSGWDVTRMYVEIDPEKGQKEEIKVTMQVGT